MAKIPIGGKIYIGEELSVVGRTQSLMFVLDTPYCLWIGEQLKMYY